jgi:hypothetical protein
MQQRKHLHMNDPLGALAAKMSLTLLNGGLI